MNIIADLHMHTGVCRHGHSTMREMAAAAGERGLLAMAVTEHAQACPDGTGIPYIQSMRFFDRRISGVYMLWGVESDIADYDGRLFVHSNILQQLDIVIASIHMASLRGADKETISHTWLGVANNPDVDIIGHCGRDPAKYDFNIEPVIQAFTKNGKTVEINANSLSKPEQLAQCREIAQCCKKYGTHICVSTDSHRSVSVGRFDASLKLIEELGIPEEQIINSSAERLSEWFFNRKGRRLEL